MAQKHKYLLKCKVLEGKNNEENEVTFMKKGIKHNIKKFLSGKYNFHWKIYCTSIYKIHKFKYSLVSEHKL